MVRAPHRNRRAHLFLRPHRSLFASKGQTAKASVVRKLRGNRQLAKGTLQGIANLVASSVEGLRPEAMVKEMVDRVTRTSPSRPKTSMR